VTIDGQKVKFEDFRRGLRDGSLSINFIALPGSSFSADGITITRTQGYDYNQLRSTCKSLIQSEFFEMLIGKP
jgi:hypothetical protein